MSRTIVVTGSASGIGKSTADLFLSRGDRVIGVDLRDAEVCADLSSQAGRSEAVAAVLELAPVIDAVITCAGVSGNSAAVVAVNYFGTVDFVTGLREALAAAPAPRVAVVASSVSVHAFDDALEQACREGDEAAATARAAELADSGKGAAIYPGSKAALAKWVRRTCVAPGWADAGIALNAIAPGVVLTPMTEGLFQDPKMVAAMDQAVPMPLNGHQGPEVLTAALAFLVAEENTHITGQVIFVDGGAEATHRGDSTF